MGKASRQGTCLQLPLITVRWPLWFEQLGLHLVVLFGKLRTFKQWSEICIQTPTSLLSVAGLLMHCEAMTLNSGCQDELVSALEL